MTEAGGRHGAIALRPATDEDAPFLRELFVATRAPAFATAGLPPAQLGALLRHQAAIEPRARALAHPAAEDLVVLEDGHLVGRLLLERSGSADAVVDLAIAPASQRRGLGTSLLRRLAGEAASAGRGLSLSVNRDNTGALRLYRRLGFVPVGETETDLLLARAGVAKESE